MITRLSFLPVLDIQATLLHKNNADVTITEEFVEKFTQLKAINSRWPLLASLFSYTTSEIEQIKRDVIGDPSVRAAAMMNKLMKKGATYGTLLAKVIRTSLRFSQNVYYASVLLQLNTSLDELMNINPNLQR